MKKIPKNPQFFQCEKCCYICNNKKDYAKHLLTSKHKNQYESMGKIPKNPPINIECKCGKRYKDPSGLWRHKKKCTFVPDINDESLDPLTDDDTKNNEAYLSLMMNILKQNSDFKEFITEQNKQMMDIVKEGKTINNNTSNTMTTNNKFNLNIFLNEKCKDAMNIMDFANSLEIKLTELEAVGTLGYAAGIGNIITRGLKDLDVYKRPIHCSDLKRESMHVKDQNIWILDKDKSLLETAIKRVARKNILKVKDWKTANPEYVEINSKTMDKYGQILVEATGSFEPEEKEKDMNKIIRIIAKEVVIEK